ncbi:Replication factor C large subunit [Dirofilaria immitis]
MNRLCNEDYHGLIPFATLSFFVVICFGKTRRVQRMEKQNDIASSDQQTRKLTDDKKEESLVDSIQSVQKSINHITPISVMKDCNTQTDINVINGRQNMISEYIIPKELPFQFLNSPLEENGNERIIGNRNKMQLQSLYSPTYQTNPKTSSIIVMQEEQMIDDRNGKQSSYPINSTSVTKNSALTDKKSDQEIVNNFSCKLMVSPSYPMTTAYNFLQSTKNPTEENSEYTEFTIPEFQTTISGSLMTEEC